MHLKLRAIAFDSLLNVWHQTFSLSDFRTFLYFYSMTLELGKAWNELNRALTHINVFLFGVISMNGVFFITKETEHRVPKIPVAANIALLIFLIVGLAAMIYKYFIAPASVLPATGVA
jgi:hypothetical protein